MGNAMSAVLTESQLAVFEFARGAGAMKTPSAKDLEEALEDFRKVQGSALLIGGIAVIHYGYVRSTVDVDALYADGDGGILRRLDPHFKVVLKAQSGWHHLEHRKTEVRLELVPSGAITTYGFIPGPKVVGGQQGFISLWGLIWLKLVSGRGKDDADFLELAKTRMEEFAAAREKLPAELHERFDQLLARARREMETDPNRHPDRGTPGAGPVKAREAAGRYGSGKRNRKGKRKAP
jgi:hypothetical protein